jgi:hypothetical protein
MARPAMFGRGAETLTDTSVRDTWELTPDQITLGGPGWTALLDRGLRPVVPADRRASGATRDPATGPAIHPRADQDRRAVHARGEHTPAGRDRHGMADLDVEQRPGAAMSFRGDPDRKLLAELTRLTDNARYAPSWTACSPWATCPPPRPTSTAPGARPPPSPPTYSPGYDCSASTARSPRPSPRALPATAHRRPHHPRPTQTQDHNPRGLALVRPAGRLPARRARPTTTSQMIHGPRPDRPIPGPVEPAPTRRDSPATTLTNTCKPRPTRRSKINIRADTEELIPVTNDQC